MSHSHRNEPARSRRRQLLREQLSLRSIPLAEPPVEKYNLDNHFGWKVLQKCRIGDGSFPPYLLHCVYCDKPDIREDGDRDKVMYVLYIRGKDGKEPVDVKETQTAFSTTNTVPRIAAAPPPDDPEPRRKTRTRLRRSSPVERRKLIGEFYYIPIQQRIIDKYDIRPLSQIEGNRGESDGDALGSQQYKHKVPKKSRARSSPKSWQLRAGAEYPDVEEAMATADTELSSEEDEEEEGEDTQRTLIDSLKRYTRLPTIDDCSNCFSKSPTSAELMDSPLERNKYLYVPRERYEKRARPESGSPARPTLDNPSRLDSDSPSRSTPGIASRPTSPTVKNGKCIEQE